MDLKDTRKKIDALDQQIVSLLEERWELSNQVAAYKKEHGLPILDSGREEEVIRGNIKRLRNSEYSASIQDVFEKIMEASRNLQRAILVDEDFSLAKIIGDIPITKPKEDYKVGFQGTLGSYSEEALRKYFKKPVEQISYPTFEETVEALINEEVEYCVLPIENTSSGSILDVARMIGEANVYIVGEEDLPINHCLLGLGTIEEITTVYSHVQGFLQCAPFLKDKGWQQVPYFNTAISAARVKELNQKNIGAIASKRAAEVSGLNILKEEINFNKKNFTRFIVLKKSLEVKAENNKISINFVLDHQKGALFKVLKSVVDNNLNMLKIESQPIIGTPWEYMFFMDFSGNIEDVGVKKALMEIKENTRELHFKGNYKSYEGEENG